MVSLYPISFEVPRTTKQAIYAGGGAEQVLKTGLVFQTWLLALIDEGFADIELTIGKHKTTPIRLLQLFAPNVDWGK